MIISNIWSSYYYLEKHVICKYFSKYPGTQRCFVNVHQDEMI